MTDHRVDTRSLAHVCRHPLHAQTPGGDVSSRAGVAPHGLRLFRCVGSAVVIDAGFVLSVVRAAGATHGLRPPLAQ